MQMAPATAPPAASDTARATGELRSDPLASAAIRKGA